MRELVISRQCFSKETKKFIYTNIVWKDGENYYQPRCPIPMELFRARWESSLTESPNPPPTDAYIKRPEIVLYNSAFDQAGDPEQDISSIPGAPRDDMLSEARIYEILKQHPHPNICVYYGCVRDGDYFTALCLKKYRCTLYDAIDNADTTLEPTIILDGIFKGLNFLHETLGLVHNDINPSNIMLDDEGNAVIIDFDSCMPIGQVIGSHKAGTPRWTLDPTISLPENDLYGIKLIAEYMEKNVTKIGEIIAS